MQNALFHESIADALREVVQALGGTKATGARMRPEMPADQAGRWLNDCLNADRREHLTPEQVLWLMREGRAIGAHAILAYLCAEAQYAAPVPVDPEDERAALQRQFIEASKMMTKLAERIERTNSVLGVA